MRLGVHTPARRTPSRLAALAVASTLLLGTAACSGGDEPGDELSDGRVPSASPSATPGAELETELVKLSTPEGFVLQEAGNKDAVVAAGPESSTLTVVAVDAPGEPASIESQGETALEGLGKDFELQEPVEVDGVEMWHANGTEAKGQATDVYGAVVDGKAVRLTIRLDAEAYSGSEMAAARQQVLDTWTWND